MPEIKFEARKMPERLVEMLSEIKRKAEEMSPEDNKDIIVCVKRREELLGNASILMEMVKYTDYLMQNAEAYSNREIKYALAATEALFIMAEQSGLIKINDKFTPKD